MKLKIRLVALLFILFGCWVVVFSARSCYDDIESMPKQIEYVHRNITFYERDGIVEFMKNCVYRLRYSAEVEQGTFVGSISCYQQIDNGVQEKIGFLRVMRPMLYVLLAIAGLGCIIVPIVLVIDTSRKQ